MNKGLMEINPLKPKRNVLCGLFAAALLAQPFQAIALGLGELEYSSYLGNVLKGEITLISRGEDYTEEQLAIRQVGEKRAAELGIELISSRYQFDFKPVLENGQLKIKLTSRQVVTEPFINILVELQWPKGSVYREYTFLLDPPPARPKLSQVAKAAGNMATAPAAQRTQKQTRPSYRPQAKAVADMKPGGKYKVQPGDTLSGIAASWSENSSHSRQETMDWLFVNNPQAFVRSDINRLKAGATLQLPEKQAGALINSAETAATEQSPVAETKAPDSQVEDGSAAVREGVVSLANPSVMTVDDLRKMNLTDATAKAMQTHIDATREVIDKLSRDNEDMRERLQNIENSEYLDLLKQLVIAQKQQIEELRSQARELAGMDQAASIGGSNIPVEESVSDGVRATDVETVVIESSSPSGAIEVNSVTGRALEQSAGNLNPWLVFLSALWVPAILIGAFMFWRKKRQTTPDVNDHMAINAMIEAEEKALRERQQQNLEEGEDDALHEPEVLKAQMQSVLDKGLEINPEDAEFLMGGRADELPDNIEGLDATASPDDFADINRELMESFELNDNPALREELEVKGRRPDEQLKEEIRKKTAGYTPPKPEFGEYSFDDDDFELEIDPDALADDLDEVVFANLPEVDETDDIIQKALIYTTYGRYTEAESLLLNQIAVVGEEPRIMDALADVRELKEKDKDL